MTAKEVLENYCSNLKTNFLNRTNYFYIDVDQLSFDRHVSFKENLRNNFLKSRENYNLDKKNLSLEEVQERYRTLPLDFMILYLVQAKDSAWENIKDTDMILDSIEYEFRF